MTPWTSAYQASLSFTISLSLLKLMSLESVMPSNHLIFFPLLFLPSIFPSIRVFSNESALRIKRPKYWSFSFSISPSKEYSGLIPFRVDWLDLLAVQGTVKSLLQHHSSKASILQHSAFFTDTKIPIDIYWRRKRQPTPICLPRESVDRGAWWAAVDRVAQSQTQLKRLSSSSRGSLQGD